MELTENIARLTKADITPEEILKEFSIDYLDPQKCREWVLKKLHPDGARCPECGADIQGKSLKRFWSADRIKCKSCGKFFTALTNTFLSRKHGDFRKVFAMALFFNFHLTNTFIGEKLGDDPDTIRAWRKLFYNPTNENICQTRI